VRLCDRGRDHDGWSDSGFGLRQTANWLGRKGFNDLKKLGLVAGALGFWALSFDPFLKLSNVLYIMKVRLKQIGFGG